MRSIAIILSILAILNIVGADMTGTCWLDSYGRGAGNVITTCDNGLDKNGALCYHQCAPGYTGVGPVCWQGCPPGYRDDGAFCFKPAPYGRGAGYALWNEDKCNREHPQGCEKWGLIYYPRCAPGFHNAACCICSPNCPDGMTDIGISCAKKSYGRGAGEVLRCAPGEEMNGALCYRPCAPGYKGIGPVCWGQCPPHLDSCGALCVPYGQCTSQIMSLSLSAFQDAAKAAASFAAQDYVGGAVNTAKALLGVVGSLNFPICGQSQGVMGVAGDVIVTTSKVVDKLTSMTGK